MTTDPITGVDTVRSGCDFSTTEGVSLITDALIVENSRAATGVETSKRSNEPFRRVRGVSLITEASAVNNSGTAVGVVISKRSKEVFRWSCGVSLTKLTPGVGADVVRRIEGGVVRAWD